MAEVLFSTFFLEYKETICMKSSREDKQFGS
jgi:hypothetical protein